MTAHSALYVRLCSSGSKGRREWAASGLVVFHEVCKHMNRAAEGETIAGRMRQAEAEDSGHGVVGMVPRVRADEVQCVLASGS